MKLTLTLTHPRCIACDHFDRRRCSGRAVQQSGHILCSRHHTFQLWGESLGLSATMRRVLAHSKWKYASEATKLIEASKRRAA